MLKNSVAVLRRHSGARVLEYLVCTTVLRSSFDSLAPAHLALAGLPNGSLPDRLPSGRVLALHRLQNFLKCSSDKIAIQ
ncbi:MAG: hypothetical protein ACOYK6_06415 [Chthoniobacterales bacterium]